MYKFVNFLNRLEAKYHRLSAAAKMSQCNLGNGVTIGKSQTGAVHVTHPMRLTIGDHTVINGSFTIDATGYVEFGRYCHVGEHLTIYSSNHDFKDSNYIPYGPNKVRKRVIISDFVWIGANVTILPGAFIGEGCVIGAGTVVYGEIPSGSIVANGGMKKIGVRDMSAFSRAKKNENFI